ncbi:MAG TPA: Crp/Fnr family transcriptional regulator [Abditibacteriaceae bacterium]|jgi:CRP-like cAMP-binding protein
MGTSTQQFQQTPHQRIQYDRELAKNARGLAGAGVLTSHMRSVTPQPFNSLLAALPEAEWNRIHPHLKRVRLAQGDVLQEVEQKIQSVYFLDSGVASFTLTSSDGNDIEVGAVGREGVVAESPLCHGEIAFCRAVTQVGGIAWRLPSAQLHDLLRICSVFEELMMQSWRVSTALQAQHALCHNRHRLEERLCYWLLTRCERIEANTLHFTQEYISQMLGVRRSGVTIACGQLREEGLIEFSRGCITLLKREEMANRACECHACWRRHVKHLLSRYAENRSAQQVAA